jgi:hemerythrin superfamily protein
MATTATKPRAARKSSGETPAERSAAVAGEPRDDNGRFTEAKPTPAKSRASKPRAASAGKKSSSGSSTGTLVGVAAAGLAVGLAANVARKLVVQGPTALAGDWDVALAAEHQATLEIFEAMQRTTEKNTTKRGTLLAQLKHALSKHALEEENVIYPALREAGEVEAADGLNKDHGYVKQYLYELTEMPKDSIEFLPKLQKFRTDLERHMREEEGDLFPRLKLKLSAEKNKELTVAVNKEGLKLA